MIEKVLTLHMTSCISW